MRRICLLRHAKSSHDDPRLSDHERPLAARGLRDAGLLAAHLKSEGLPVDLVLCSTARRARETIEAVLPGLPPGVEVLVEDGLYAVGPDDLLRRLHRLPDEVRCPLLCGHNPAIEQASGRLLAGGPGRRAVAEGMPTGALVVIRLPAIRWTGLGTGTGELLEYVVPKGLRSARTGEQR